MGKLKVLSHQEVIRLLNQLMEKEMQLESILKPQYLPILGDCRSDKVKHGEYEIYNNGKLYHMDTFRGFVKKIQYYPLMNNNMVRARITIELKDNKKLAFFAWIDHTIKTNTIIEAIGICLKEGSFYNLKCYGGVMRIITPYEAGKLARGTDFSDLELEEIPYEILSELKVTTPMKGGEYTEKSQYTKE